MITKYRWTANTPRAHITNQRAMEIFRDFGIEDQVLADATPHELVGDTVFCTSIAGEEIGRIRTWGTHPAREADYQLASPCLVCDIPQTYLEPILVKNATARGTQTRFSTEYLSHAQDEDGVTTTVRDRLTGQVYNIRSKYLIGADGARSKVAEDIGLPLRGPDGHRRLDEHHVQGRHLAHVGPAPPSCTGSSSPGSNVGGIGAGPGPDGPAVERVADRLGLRHQPAAAGSGHRESHRDRQEPPRHARPGIEITGTSLWGNNEMYATHLQKQRVFAAGDAVHRHPPSNGLGSNTSIQDSYNLAWKLAAVLKHQAGPELLETYSTERAPVAGADRQAGQQVEPRVRPVLRGARPDGGRDRRGDGAADRGAQGQHPARPRQARSPGRGDGTQGLRVQRPRRRSRPVLRVDRDRSATDRKARAGTRPRAVLPGLHRPRLAPAARLGRRRHAQGLHPRPRPVHHVHADHRHHRRGRGRRPPRRWATTSASRSRR